MTTTRSRSSRRALPIQRSATPFCQGLRGAVRLGFMPRDFTIEGGELTPTLKVKRRVITTKYGDLIDTMYSAAEANEPALEEAG